jgi:phage terminase large subunit GpA-like protein
MLSFGLDVQKFGFWFAVRAWAETMTSWLVHYGFLPTWEEVEKIIFETSYPVEGEEERSLRIIRACVDTGGAKKFEDMTMTEETYFWLLKNRGRNGVSLWGTKGSSKSLPGMLSLGSGILSTPSGKKLPDELRLLMVDTEKAKDQYHYRLQLAMNEETHNLPGAAFLHSGVGDDYVSQILAEEKQMDDKGREIWVNPHGRPNHLLDADLLAAVPVEIEFPGGGLRLLAEHSKQNREAPKYRNANEETGNGRAARGYSRPSWMERR